MVNTPVTLMHGAGPSPLEENLEAKVRFYRSNLKTYREWIKDKPEFAAAAEFLNGLIPKDLP